MSERRYAPGNPAILSLALTSEQTADFVKEYMAGRLSTRMMHTKMKNIPGLQDLKRQDVWAWINERLESDGPQEVS
jgi:hypothetical protein